MIGRPGADELLFLPLGGAGEIGMNLSLYGHAGKWLMIDLGVMFGDERTPGIELIVPDPAFITERRDDLAGLVITHAHEDHLGAVPHLWPRLRCPIYATPFAASVLRRKLREAGLQDEAPITEIALSGRFSVGPFDLELITLTHSIPEPNAIAIRTSAGTVLHTGDWKLDPEPLEGPVSDEAALRRLGREGVLAMVCDSTNALVAGSSGSEAALRESLIRLVGTKRRRVVVTCFASNVARMRTMSDIAGANGRHAALVGRSLWRIEQAARETGYLQGVPDFITEHDVGYLDRDRALIVCTGSQGEPRSALARIARRDHPNVELEAGDTVIFSSRVIPGNEDVIYAMQNELVRQGVEVVSEPDAFVHVSGHPARDELATMYQWVRPRIAVPVHGELRHLTAHAALAKECQVPEALVPLNGQLIRLAPGPAAVVEEVTSGRLGVDGNALVSLNGARLKNRHRLAFSGAALVTIAVDRSGELAADPQLDLPGLVDEIDDALTGEALTAIRDALKSLPASRRGDDAAVKETVRRAVRRAVRQRTGKKPVTLVHLVRV